MRHYKRKTTKADVAPDIILKAVRCVKRDHRTIRSVSKEFNISYTSLARYCRQATVQDIWGDSLLPSFSIGYSQETKIFTQKQEADLMLYLRKAAKTYYGLQPKEIRKFAYQFAKMSNCKIPKSWQENESAGADFLLTFLKRHPELVVRKSRPDTSITPKLSVTNKSDVFAFYRRWKLLLQRRRLVPSDIWNMDEVGINLAHVQNDRTLLRRDFRSMWTEKNPPPISMAITVSAAGKTILPFFVFTKEDYGFTFMREYRKDGLYDINCEGWMNEDIFRKYARHFVEHTGSSKKKPKVLFLDNHNSHLSVETMLYLQENGVLVISFPPGCADKLQPLDHTIYPILKYHINAIYAAMGGGNIVTTEVAKIVSTSYEYAIMSGAIKRGFQQAGIWPFNENVSVEKDNLQVAKDAEEKKSETVNDEEMDVQVVDVKRNDYNCVLVPGNSKLEESAITEKDPLEDVGSSRDSPRISVKKTIVESCTLNEASCKNDVAYQVCDVSLHNVLNVATESKGINYEPQAVEIKSEPLEDDFPSKIDYDQVPNLPEPMEEIISEHLIKKETDAISVAEARKRAEFFDSIYKDCTNVIPNESWAIHKQAASIDKMRAIVFSMLDYVANDSKVPPVYSRQIILYENLSAKVFLYSMHRPELSVNISCHDDLINLLKNVNELTVCRGGPSLYRYENVVTRIGVKEYMSFRWRHKSCELVLKKNAACKACLSLHNAFKKKVVTVQR